MNLDNTTALPDTIPGFKSIKVTGEDAVRHTLGYIDAYLTRCPDKVVVWETAISCTVFRILTDSNGSRIDIQESDMSKLAGLSGLHIAQS